MQKKIRAESTAASVAAGIAPVPAAAHNPAAEHTVLEARPFAEVIVAGLAAEHTVLEARPFAEVIVAGLAADIVDQVLHRIWRHHPGVDSSHFEEERHQLGRPESGVASRPSPGQRSDSGCMVRVRVRRLPQRLDRSDHRFCDGLPV